MLYIQIHDGARALHGALRSIVRKACEVTEGVGTPDPNLKDLANWCL